MASACTKSTGRSFGAACRAAPASAPERRRRAHARTARPCARMRSTWRRYRSRHRSRARPASASPCRQRDLRPARAARPVPPAGRPSACRRGRSVGDLVGVLIVTGWGIHWCGPFYRSDIRRLKRSPCGQAICATTAKLARRREIRTPGRLIRTKGTDVFIACHPATNMSIIAVICK